MITTLIFEYFCLVLLEKMKKMRDRGSQYFALLGPKIFYECVCPSVTHSQIHKFTHWRFFSIGRIPENFRSGHNHINSQMSTFYSAKTIIVSWIFFEVLKIYRKTAKHPHFYQTGSCNYWIKKIARIVKNATNHISFYSPCIYIFSFSIHVYLSIFICLFRVCNQARNNML